MRSTRSAPKARSKAARRGLGFALMEEIQVEDGLIRNASFTDYLVPTALDVPPIVVDFVEEAEPGAPYGVKGIGELPTVVAAAGDRRRAACTRPGAR